MTVLGWILSLSGWVLLLLAIGVALYLFGTSTFNHFAKQNAPFVKPSPFFGSMGAMFIRRQHFPHFILDLYNKLKDHQYGGIFMFRQPTVLVRDPELIKTITVKDFEYFTDHRTFVAKDGDLVFSRGLFNLAGQRWKEMRSTLSPAFTSSKMKTMFVLVSECCKQFVQFLEEYHKHTPSKDCIVQKDGELLILELKDLYTRYTNDVIATTAFGVGVDSLKQPKNEFYLMGQDFTNMGGFRIFKWLGYMALPKFMQMLGIRLISKKVTDFFTFLVLDTIATRERENITRPDMLQLLMQAQKGTLHEENSTDSNKSTKLKLEDEDIIAQALLFFLAGFDTTSTLLCFASHLLATHPEIQTRLLDEIDKTLQENGEKFTYEGLHSMKYLDMIISETLRIYPPAASIDRVCVQRYTLKADPPLEMNPGDVIFFPIFGIHRDPQYFPDPERFDPERFSDENKHNINPLTYLPFGSGPRICIGNRFALMETKLVLVHLLAKFNFKVIAKTPIPIKIIQKGFNMSIDGGFWLGLEPRNF